MTNRLPFEDELEAQLLAGLPRARRRRLVRRAAAVAGGSLLVAALIVPVLSRGEGEDESVISGAGPAPSNAAASAQALPTPVGVSEEHLSLPVGSLAYGDFGIDEMTSTGEVVRRLNESVAVARIAGDAGIVYQSRASADARGAITFAETGETIDSGEDRTTTLHDAARIDGRDLVLYADRMVSSAAAGQDPDRLSVFDVQAGTHRDVGRFGGAETRLTRARLTPWGIVAVVVGDGAVWLEAVGPDGESLYRTDLELGGWSLTVGPSGELFAVTREGEGDELSVRVIEFDETGRVADRTSPRSQRFDSSAVCGDVAVAGGLLICDQVDAAPVAIDPVSGDIAKVEPFEAGAVVIPVEWPSGGQLIDDSPE